SRAPDGGERIGGAISANFMNYNLRLFVSEGLLNRFYRETRREMSPVQDRVMEAYISGYQCTNVDVSLNIVPSSRDARFNMVLSGVVQSNTNGYTDQATVHTVGYHTFRAEKPIIFNGDEFYGEPGRVSVSANN